MRKIMIAFAVVAGCLTIACTNEQKPAKTTENAVAANEELVLDTAMMEDVMAVFDAVNEVIEEMSDEEIIEMLDSSMMEMNNELPKEVAAGMTITKVDYSDKTITFFTEIDEQQIEIGDVTEEDMTKVMKEGILEKQNKFCSSLVLKSTLASPKLLIGPPFSRHSFVKLKFQSSQTELNTSLGRKSKINFALLSFFRNFVA